MSNKQADFLFVFNSVCFAAFELKINEHPQCLIYLKLHVKIVTSWMKGCLRLKTQPFIRRGIIKEAGPPGQHFLTYDKH